MPRSPASSLRQLGRVLSLLLLFIAPWAHASTIEGRKPLTWANNFSRGNKKAGRKLLTWGNSLGWGNGVGGAQWCGPMMQWINRSCVPGGGLVQPAGGYPHPYPRNNGNGNGSGGTACTTSTARAANGATSTSTSCAGQGSATSSSSGKSGKKR